MARSVGSLRAICGCDLRLSDPAPAGNGRSVAVDEVGDLVGDAGDGAEGAALLSHVLQLFVQAAYGALDLLLCAAADVLGLLSGAPADLFRLVDGVAGGALHLVNG